MSALASGTYRYWRDGQPQAITEPWSLMPRDGGLLLRGKRLVDGLPFLDVEADYEGPHCVALRLHWQPPAPAAPRGVEYRLDAGLLRWRFAQETDWRELSLPTEALLYPLLRAATGPLLGLLTGGARTVVLPCIRDARDDAAFLHPLHGPRRITMLTTWPMTGTAGDLAERAPSSVAARQLLPEGEGKEEPLSLRERGRGEGGGGEDDSTSRNGSTDGLPTLRYHGGEYGEAGCECWLDPLGLLSRYRWATPQGEWDVRLEDLYCAEGFAGFVNPARSGTA